MLPLSLFRIPSFTGVQIGAFAIAGSQFALFLYITLYLQNILGYSPLEAGLRYLPITLASFFVAPLSGQLMNRIQPRFLIGGGLVLAGIGLILMSGVEEGDTWTTLLGGFLVGGVGHRPAQPADRGGLRVGRRAGAERDGRRHQQHVPPGRHRGRHRGVRRALPQPGGERDRRDRTAAGDAHRVAEAVSSGDLPRGGPEQLVTAAREGFFAGFNEILLIGGGLALAGAVAALILVRPQDMRTEAVPAAAAA